MKQLEQVSGLTDRVYTAILNEILDGTLSPGEHLVQEQLAEQLGVSRQPVQQAMALLKADGLVRQIGRRGLRVAELDLDRMHNHYDLRGLIDAYCAKAAAERIIAGQIDQTEAIARMNRLFKTGNDAATVGSTRELIKQDEIFHREIYKLSGNPIVEEAVEPHWRFLRRAMAEVLRHAKPAGEIWDQHAEIADAVLSGEPEKAEALALDHTRVAATELSAALKLSRTTTAAE
ncbi:MAG: GntR family transcriptional regulator [Pseudomonadota bacterium]